MATAKRTAVRGKRARVSKKDPHPQPLPTRGRGEERASPVAKAKASAKLSKATPKGGPVAGTPSPMRTRLSAELQAHARRLFTQTDQPGTEIAADCGVDESVIRRLAKREGWVRYVAPPRELPPVAKLLTEVEKLEASFSKVPSTASRCFASASSLKNTAAEGRLCPSPQGEGEKEAPQGDGENADIQKDIAEFERAVMGYVRDFDALRKNGMLLPTQRLAVARAINALTDAFNKLQRMRANLPGSTHDDTYDMPADPDAFRDELARRIDAFIASRANAADAADDAAAPPDETP